MYILYRLPLFNYFCGSQVEYIPSNDPSPNRNLLYMRSSDPEWAGQLNTDVLIGPPYCSLVVI